MKVTLQFTKKSYEDKDIFDIGHHEFGEGKIHGIIGANGVGKTTLLRILAGLDSSFSGHVLYDGCPYSDALRRRMTYISQKPYMLNRSVYENLAYPLRIRKVSSDEITKRIDEMMELMNLHHLASKSATVLSAGEREKVNIARGLIYKPDVVILDEPTASIDPDTVTELERTIIEYQRKQNATVIVVTHNLSQALRLCDTLHVFENKGLRPVSKDEIIENIKKLNTVEDLLSMDYKILGV